jgi:CRP-like cAMP-binding protein
MRRASRRTQERLLILAGLLGIAGLALAALYVVKSTPYTMVGFMAGGITMIGLSAAIFGLVTLRDVRYRLASLSSQEFPAGEIICQQGDQPEFMLVITEGEVEFVAQEEGKGEIAIGKLGPADYFGDMAILSDTPHQATARALTDVTGMVIHRHDFEQMYTQLPDLRERVQKEQQRKKKMVEEKLGKSTS